MTWNVPPDVRALLQLAVDIAAFAGLFVLASFVTILCYLGCVHIVEWGLLTIIARGLGLE